MSFDKFVQLILSQPVKPPIGLQQIDQDFDGSVISVSKLESTSYRPLYCWYNCYAQVNKSGGRILYGWALHKGPGRYEAQHHAVWKSPAGETIDITPDQNLEDTVFLVDGRAVFDFENRKHPPSFYLFDGGETKWGMMEPEFLKDDYFIMTRDTDEHVKYLLSVDA